MIDRLMIKKNEDANVNGDSFLAREATGGIAHPDIISKAIYLQLGETIGKEFDTFMTFGTPPVNKIVLIKFLRAYTGTTANIIADLLDKQ